MFNAKRFYLIILVGFLSIPGAHIVAMQPEQQDASSIPTVDSFDLLAQIAQALGSEDLVAFDVDAVLLKEGDAIFSSPLCAELLCEGSRYSLLPPEERAYLDTVIGTQSYPIPIDPRAAELIRFIQSRGTKTIALSAIGAGGRHGCIEDLGVWRYEQLKKLGIDFSGSFPSLNEEPLVLFPESGPVRAQLGIVLTGKHPKGETLKAFLAAIKWRPRSVTFIDDKKYYVESVVAACKDLGIPCNGIHYTGELKIKMQADPAVARFQVDYLIEHRTWLRDHQARALMRQLQEAQEQEAQETAASA